MLSGCFNDYKPVNSQTRFRAAFEQFTSFLLRKRNKLGINSLRKLHFQ
jgi:hypothetical protein